MSDRPAAQLRPLPIGSIIKVAGVTHRQDDVRTAKVGQPLIIAHDPANGADEHACAISTADGRKLGYVPRAGDLARRLAMFTPHGRWAGEVVEVLSGDTWGLRVKVGPLQGVDPHPPAAGEQTGGVRDIADLVDEDGHPLDTTAEVTVPEDQGGLAAGGGSPGEAPRVPQVFARSGRLLGELVGVVDSRVTVRRTDGSPATFPSAIVRIAD